MMRDPYLYPDSDVLRNLAGIQDSEELKNMEADYTLFRLSEIAEDKSPEQFDFCTLCGLHYRIFQDVYEWAGKPRKINIEKAEAVLGEISIVYSDCFDIAEDTERILRSANCFDWKQDSFEKVVIRFSDFMADLWKVHPFREGNTRTVVTFCSMFIEAQGIYIESELFKDNATYMRNALVAANAVFDDLGDLRKPGYLYRIVQDALERGQKMKEQVAETIRKSGLSDTEERIKEVILWNRKEKREHLPEEIREMAKTYPARLGEIDSVELLEKSSESR